MKLTLLLGAVLLFVTACTTTQEITSTDSDKNPDTYCLDQGAEPGMSEYKECIENYIHEQCTALGLEEGTDAYMQCAEDLRIAGFIRGEIVKLRFRKLR